MNDYIFSKMTVKKRDLYSTIKNLLTSNGWQNISSNSVTDYDVFYSKGTSGTHDLYFQIRDLDINGANSFSTTKTGYYFSGRLINRYVPGNPGSAGIFDRPGESWRVIVCVNGSIDLDTSFTLWYHVNANRIIFNTEPPYSVNATSQFNLIGMPDNTFGTEVGSRGVMFCGGSMYQASTNNLFITDYDYRNSTSSITNKFYANTMNAHPTYNSARKIIVSDIAYGSDSDSSVRGLIDGLYVLTSGTNASIAGINQGDVFKSGEKIYRVNIQSRYSSSSGWAYNFPGYVVLYRIQ